MNEDLKKKITTEETKKKNIKKANENFGVEVGEDTTKYGEFISSYFAWVSLPEQKAKAEKMQNMTKKEDRKK